MDSLTGTLGSFHRTSKKIVLVLVKMVDVTSPTYLSTCIDVEIMAAKIPCVCSGGIHNRYFVLLQVAIRVYLYNKIGPHMSEDNFLCFTPEEPEFG